MTRLAPSGDVLGRIARLLEEGTMRPDVATVYPLQDAAQTWKDIAGNLPGVHGMSPSGRGEARRRSHGKILLRVAGRVHEIRRRAHELYLARGHNPVVNWRTGFKPNVSSRLSSRAERIESELCFAS